MPRKARIDAPGALHHVIVRGIERKKIFRSDYDRQNLVKRLSDLIPETRTDRFAWALILNNFHLLLRTGSVPIAVLMRRLLTGYAGWFNRKYNRHGQLFQIYTSDTFLINEMSSSRRPWALVNFSAAYAP